MVSRTPLLIFVSILIVMYLLLTYSYAGYKPNFPEETLHSVPYKGNGFTLETDSVADRVVKNAM